MAGITKKEKRYKDLLIQWSYSYLYGNRGVFSQDNKIKIALAIAQRDIAQKHEFQDKDGKKLGMLAFFSE